jgi:hypothetical protein
MYAKIENGVAVEYPVYEGDLQKLFPDLTYPLDVSGNPIPEGYVKVQPAYPNNLTDLTYKHTMVMPVQVDGVWKETFVSTKKEGADLEAALHAISKQVRDDRDAVLKLTDIKVKTDLWDDYTDTEKKEWKDYRKALRDIPEQEGFPLNVEWPIEPSTFAIKVI